MSDAFQRACELAGGVSRLAERISEVTGEPHSQSRLSNWKATRVPCESVIHVAKAVNFGVTPHELDDKLYPNPDDALPTEFRQARQHA
jgi:DNA-binding transcriptional regulator YdaS (Cro superfamily)